MREVYPWLLALPPQSHVAGDILRKVPAGHPQAWIDAFATSCADAHDASARGSPEGLPTVRDGLRSMRIVDAVLRSARDAAWTPVA